MGGTYVLYHAQEPFTGYVPRWEMIRTIIGLALFIAGITFVSRVPRLVKFGSWNVVLLGFFALGSWAYCSWVALSVQESLAKGFADWPTSDPQWKIIGVGYIIAVFSAIWSKLRPSWGMKPLMFLATGLTLCTVIGIISAPNTHVELSAWPLFLAGLGFLYLWWLAALIFDLVFVWHHYIRSNAAGDFLKSIYRR